MVSKTMCGIDEKRRENENRTYHQCWLRFQILFFLRDSKCELATFSITVLGICRWTFGFGWDTWHRFAYGRLNRDGTHDIFWHNKLLSNSTNLNNSNIKTNMRNKSTSRPNVKRMWPFLLPGELCTRQFHSLRCQIATNYYFIFTVHKNPKSR